MSLNRVLILGHLGADPELRYTQGGTPVCNLRVATNDRRKDANGEWVDQTEWHAVVVFGKVAENCSKFLAKGRQVFVEGKLQTRKWQDQEGKDRYKTEIVAFAVQFIGGRGESQIPVEKSYVGESAGNEGLSGMNEGSGFSESVSFADDDVPF